MVNKKIQVLNKEIRYSLQNEEDYICLTDMIIDKSPESLNRWLRSRKTIDFLGVWEKIHNNNFNYVDFDTIKNKAGTKMFRLSVKDWIKNTNARGIYAKAGRYGGTYAHIDIALEFASWISPEFKLYLIKDFRRLKEEESKNKSQEWNIKRTLTKINYKIHTEAIKQNLIPKKVSNQQERFVYSDEADILNVALFGKTAKEWREENKDKKGNIRDYTDVTQLVCLANLENLNAYFIKQDISQENRLIELNNIAISQMSILLQDDSIKSIKY